MLKKSKHPTCIDLILTNRPKSFQNTCVVETGLSDFHKLTTTVLKSNFSKQAPKIMYYRNYKNFKNKVFRNDLLTNIGKQGYQEMGCKEFESLLLDILNVHAPLKKRFIRANNAPFMTNNAPFMTNNAPFDKQCPFHDKPIM